MIRPLALFLSLAATAASLLGATSTFPLTENAWSNPEFVDRFVGTYGFDMETNPKISSEEQTLFAEIAPMAERQPQVAIQRLRDVLTPESSAALDFTLGSLMLQQGNTRAAVESYRTAIRKFPNFFRAYQNLGLAYIQLGDFNSALQFLTKAVEIGGGNGGLYGLIGYAYLQTDRPSFALDAYRFALMLQPESRDWRLGKLNALLGVGDDDAAVAMLNDLIAEEPGNTEYWLMQAQAFVRQEAYGDAAANLEVVRSLGQPNAASLALLGDLYLNENLPELAADPYAAAIRETNVDPGRAVSLARKLAYRADYETVSAVLGAVRDRFGEELPPADALDLLVIESRLLLAADRAEEARTTLEEIVNRDPLNGDALMALGDYHFGQEAYEEAAFRYEAATKVDDVALRAFTALARVHVRQDDLRGAITSLRRAQQIEYRDSIDAYLEQLERALRARNS